MFYCNKHQTAGSLCDSNVSRREIADCCRDSARCDQMGKLDNNKYLESSDHVDNE